MRLLLRLFQCFLGKSPLFGGISFLLEPRTLFFLTAFFIIFSTLLPVFIRLLTSLPKFILHFLLHDWVI